MTLATAPRELQITGTPGHAHAYWTLRTPVGLPDIELANRRLAHRLDGDLSSVDAARILRPPASWNHKHSPPTPVQLVELDPGRRYEIGELVNGLEDRPGAPARGPVAPPRSGRNEIDRTLLAIPAADYARALVGRSPNRAGKIACPFHDDHTPSLQLYDDGTWYCYGACQTGGSIYDFASRAWGIETKGPSFLELRDRLAHDLKLAVRPGHTGRQLS